MHSVLHTNMLRSSSIAESDLIETVCIDCRNTSFSRVYRTVGSGKLYENIFN